MSRKRAKNCTFAKLSAHTKRVLANEREEISHRTWFSIGTTTAATQRFGYRFRDKDTRQHRRDIPLRYACG